MIIYFIEFIYYSSNYYFLSSFRSGVLNGPYEISVKKMFKKNICINLKNNIKKKITNHSI